ncbi:MAG: ribulose-phosphate 3-epimerase [Candidatus Saelkia tenebricola]|nr:ribulose-phosphate 3-epimerase [Candidatus Saelkia tenebricola]
MVYYPQIKIAPSILAADYSKLAEELIDVEKRGVDLMHIDIMDGHFVPNITIGPGIVRTIKKVTSLPLDVHLMIEDPYKYIPEFIDSGADIINFHVEVFLEDTGLNIKNLVKTYQSVKGIRTALTINPPTKVECFREILSTIDLDFILIMSVNPGFGGQSFINDVLDKVRILREDLQFKGDIQIDGGINASTAESAVEAGCNILVAGTYIFGASDRTEAINSLKNVKRRKQ